MSLYRSPVFIVPISDTIIGICASLVQYLPNRFQTISSYYLHTISHPPSLSFSSLPPYPHLSVVRDWYAFPVLSQGSCLQSEQRLSLQINLSEIGERPADLDKLKPYIIEHILMLLMAPAAGRSTIGGFPWAAWSIPIWKCPVGFGSVLYGLTNVHHKHSISFEDHRELKSSSKLRC